MIGVLLIVLLVFIAALFIKALSKPAQTYDFLQDHLVLKDDPIPHSWLPQENPPSDGRPLSHTDMILMSRILQASEQGKKSWGGNNILEEQALMGITSILDAYSKCRLKIGTCSITLRLNRVLTPNHVNGDLRIVNIEERSHRVDLTADPETDTAKNKNDTPQFRIAQNRMEVRNLRFAKRRDGWSLRTIDVLESKPMTTKRVAKVPLQKFAGINYYPAKSSWRDFWPEFPKETIKKDLALIRSLGGNSLRIFLTHSIFTDMETEAQAKTRLVEFMDMAQDAGLKVIPTVFDLRPDYRLENWDSDVAYLMDILPLIQDHPALLALDLKNQINLDVPLHGEGLIMGWISVMVQSVRREFPNIPLTIGFSTSEAAIKYGQDLDVISYHDYEPVRGFVERTQNVRDAYPNRPIWITELGSTVWTPVPFIGLREVKQAKRLTTQLTQSDLIDGIFLWTLFDFDHVGSDVVGWRPWRKKQQAHYGLFDLDGAPRPAVDVFVNYANATSSTYSLKTLKNKKSKETLKASTVSFGLFSPDTPFPSSMTAMTTKQAQTADADFSDIKSSSHMSSNPHSLKP